MYITCKPKMYLTIKKKKAKTPLHLLGAKIPKAQKRKNPQGAAIFTGFMHVVSLDLKKSQRLEPRGI